MQTISKDKQEKLKKNGIDVKFAAEASAVGIGSMKTDRQFKVSMEDKKKFEQSVEKTNVVSIGSKPPANGNSFINFSWKAEILNICKVHSNSVNGWFLLKWGLE